MLSVLIPVFNREVTTLVDQLLFQLNALAIPYEIVLLDDASDQVFHEQNGVLAEKENVRYERQERNLGRSKARNYLADRAKYPYLLFIDCDAAVKSNHFIENYLTKIKSHTLDEELVLLGGVAYRNTPPGEEFRLRWYYGRKREEIPASSRQKNAYQSFTPFNVLITKKLFEKIRFDESLETYGNEDTFFGYELKKNRVKILHIDNPLYHDGLDENGTYIEKVEMAVDNLLNLTIDKPVDSLFINDNRLLSTYMQCKKWGLLPLVKQWFLMRKKKLRQKLAKKPNLFLLDLYKLGYISSKL